jgi:uncharacterized protein
MGLGPEAEFHEFLAAGRFMIQRCRTSGRCAFYPRVAEPASGDLDLDWVQASGDGTVYSVTVVRPKPPAAPYVVALVDLAEGPRIMTTVEGMPPEGVRIGMHVTGRVVHRDGQHMIVFESQPAAARSA